MKNSLRRFISKMLASMMAVSMMVSSGISGGAPFGAVTVMADTAYDSLKVIPDSDAIATSKGENVTVYVYNSETFQGEKLDGSKYTVQFSGSDKKIPGNQTDKIAEAMPNKNTVESVTVALTADALKESKYKKVPEAASERFMSNGGIHIVTGITLNGQVNTDCTKITRVEVLPYAQTALAYDQVGILFHPSRTQHRYMKKTTNSWLYLDHFPNEPGTYEASLSISGYLQSMDSNFTAYFTLDESLNMVSNDLSEGSVVVDPVARKVEVRTKAGSVVSENKYTLSFYQFDSPANYYVPANHESLDDPIDILRGGPVGESFPTEPGLYSVTATAIDGGGFENDISCGFVLGSGNYASIEVDTGKKKVTVSDKNYNAVSESDYTLTFYPVSGKEKDTTSFPETPGGRYYASVKAKKGSDAIESLPFTVYRDAKPFTASITKISFNKVDVDGEGNKFVPIEVTLTAEGQLTEASEEVACLEGYVSAKHAKGENYIEGLYLDTLREYKEQQGEMENHEYRWSPSSNTGKLRYNIPVLDSSSAQTVKESWKKDLYTVNGIVDGDSLKFLVETELDDGQFPRSNIAEVPFNVSELPKTYVIKNDQDPISSNRLSLDKSSATLNVGEKIQLNAKFKGIDGKTEDVTDSVTWTSDNEAFATVANGETPGLVTGVAEGTAVITAENKDGYKATCTVTVTKAADDPNKEPELKPEDNKPMAVSTETVGEFEITYAHQVPFPGKGKLTLESFGENFSVKHGSQTYKVKKIKVNKKKRKIQVTDLYDAEKPVKKAVKKATKGNNGLPYTQNPYYVKDTDGVTFKFKKSGSLAWVKVKINNKDYKAKKNEYDYNDTEKLFTFKGENLAGSWKSK